MRAGAHALQQQEPQAAGHVDFAQVQTLQQPQGDHAAKLMLGFEDFDTSYPYGL